jgi:hypothetical protein
MELNIEKLNPKKAEVAQLVEQVKNTIISLPAGNTGYDLMKENKTILQKKRTEMVNFFESERAMSNAYSKAIIQIQKDVLAIIEPVEKEIADKIRLIDEEKEKESRKQYLPARKEKLAEIFIEVDDELLLTMSEVQFAQYFNEKNGEYLAEKERKLKEAQEKIDAEKRANEEAQKRAVEIERAKTEAAEKALRDAEVEKQRALNEQKEKLEKEKQDIIDKQRAEDEKKRNEELLKKQEEEKLLKQEKYMKFLADNGWSKENEADFYILNNGLTVNLYKKVAEYKL